MAAQQSVPRRDLFGDIAVSQGLMTWAQMRDVLKKQVRYREIGIAIRVGEITVEMGLLEEGQTQAILADQRQRRAEAGIEPVHELGFDPQEWEDSGEPYPLGPYLLEKRLGGVMGIVFRGRDGKTGQQIALKILPKTLAHDQSFVERFKREVRATAALEHPNLVKMYSSGVESGVFYLATEFVEGESLAQRMRRSSPMPEDDALRIVRDVARALQHAHARGVLHRDVKPENIMIAKDGTVKLADLGLAKFLSDEQKITADGIAVGTPHYISPEQARALKATDHRSDLYCLGATLFHVVCGRLPYEGDNGAEIMKRHVFEPVPVPREVYPQLRQVTSDLILRLMEKDPDMRLQSAHQLVRQIDKILGEDLVHASHTPLPKKKKTTTLSRKPFDTNR